MRTRLLTALAGLLLVAAALLASASPAAAAAAASTYTVRAEVAADGTLKVAGTITLVEPPASVQQVIPTTRAVGDRREYRFAVSGVTVTSGGAALPATVTTSAEGVTVTIPTAGVTAPVELSYAVAGAAIRTSRGATDIVWDLVGGFSLPIAVVDATVAAPAQFTMIDCAAGASASPGACTWYAGGTHDNPQPVFHHEGLAAGDVVRTTLRFPAAAVAANGDLHVLWSLDRAFSAGPAQLAAALGLLLLGGAALWLAHRRFGRDPGAAATPTLVAGFHPVAAGRSEFQVRDGVRPGQVGTLLDEHVDPVDITATLLDLAVRGHLRIEELPRPAGHALPDWTFTRRSGGDQLAPYEATLLDAVAPADGTAATVSGLGESVRRVLPQVQSQLYDEMVSRGWFARRPDLTRSSWGRLGWIALGVAVVAAVVLAAFTTFGLAGLVLIALAVGLLAVSAGMPARTAAGASVLGGLQVLRGALLSQPTDQLPPGQEHAEVSRILPYAVVLGGPERWLAALAEQDGDSAPDPADLDWYHAPGDWHLADFPASLKAFVTTAQGTLFTR